MHGELLLDHFQNPRNAGELAPPALVVEVMNPVCGDILRLSARIEDGRVAEARFKVRGCTASIGCGSVLTGLVTGKSARELSTLRAADIEAAAGGLIPESKHSAVLCADAVKALAQRMGP